MAIEWIEGSFDIPANEPVLVKQKGRDVPFMGVIDPEFDDESIGIILGPTHEPYGVYVPLDEVEKFALVMPSLQK